jgi:Putative glutamine amidotransferase
MTAYSASGLVFEPQLSILLLVIVGALALITLGVYIWRKGRAPVLRGATLAILWLALSGPSLRREDRVSLPDVVAIIVDRSESMSLSGRSAGVEAALLALQAQLAKTPNLDVRVASMGDTPSGTSLSPALDQAFGDVASDRIAGAFVLSDGLINDASDAVRPFPLHQVMIGTPNERDRRIVVKNAPRSAPIGEIARIVVQIEDTAPSAQLTVHVGQEPPQVRDVPTGQDIVIEVPVDRRGAIPVAIETSMANGEISGANNGVALSVSGVRDRLRVMLVTGEPYAGARAWRNLLKSDPSVDLVQFTILRSPEKQDYTPVEELSLIQFPTRELFLDKINSFDLVVFDRFKRLSVLPDEYLESVAQWVEDGGALLTLAGPAEAQSEGIFSTPIARVIPASPTGKTIDTPFRPNLTQRGLSHPVSAGLAPQAPTWGQWLRVQASTARGDVLLEGAGQPLLVLSQVGKGRSAAIMSDQAWLWRRGYDGGGPFDELFRRTSHWLMKEADLEADRLVLRSAAGKLLIERRASADPGPVSIDGPTNKEELDLNQGTANLWRGELLTQSPGLHKVTSGDKQAFIIAGIGNPAEARTLRADASAFRQRQSKSGGGGSVTWVGRAGRGALPAITRIAKAQKAGDQGLALRQTGASAVTATRRDPIVPAWLYAFLIVSLSLGAWWRESR